MARRKNTKTEKHELANAKKMHKKEQRLNPAWFEAQRVDLASEIFQAAVKQPPRWGAFTFKFKQQGQPMTIIKV